jgi:hypothetical protein
VTILAFGKVVATIPHIPGDRGGVVERMSPEAKPRGKIVVRRIFAFVAVTVIAGFYGCFRSGYVTGEPNVKRPGF